MPVSLPVMFEVGQVERSGAAVNIGFGGAFIESTEQLAYGDAVELLIQFPGLARPSRLPSIVRWSSRTGFGLQFLQLGARETHAVSVLVAAARREEVATVRPRLKLVSPSTEGAAL